MKDKLLEVKDLTVEFKKGAKVFTAVDHISFDVFKGETFGLVGESGSGKTTTGRAIMGIQDIADGNVYFDDRLIRGKTPSIKSTINQIDSYLKMMIQNKNDSAKIINEYLKAFKSAYAEFVPTSPSLKSNKLTLDELKTIKIRTRATMVKVEQVVQNDLKFLIKTIDVADHIKRTIIDLRNDNEIDQEAVLGFSTTFNKIYDFILLVKKTENKVWCALDKITQINALAKKGTYDTLKHYMDDVADNLRDMVKNHRLINRILESLKLDVESLKKLPNIDNQIKESKMFKKLDKKEKKSLKQKMQMIFQDPGSSLNSRMNVEQIIGEGLENFPDLYKNEDTVNSYIEYAKKNGETLTREQVKYSDVKRFLIEQMLKAVGMLPEHLNRYPHEFSGGQKQRIGIARSLIMKPEFIIADEPISSLDVSIRAQIINLLVKFQKEYGLTYIFIAHDLTVVRFIADRIGVIYHGKLVEIAESEELFKHPLHPYTKALLNAIPIPNPEKESNKAIERYDEAKEHYDYLIDFPIWTEIKPNHFVYLNNRELEAIKKNK